MNNKSLILWVLALFLTMACMTTVEPFATYPADPTPTFTAMPSADIAETSEPEAGAVFEFTVELKPKCATVTAAEALHIRSLPSEKASVIGYLHHGEQVTVIHSLGPWWKIKAGPHQGYSKAEYLQEGECKH